MLHPFEGSVQGLVQSMDLVLMSERFVLYFSVAQETSGLFTDSLTIGCCAIVSLIDPFLATGMPDAINIVYRLVWSVVFSITTQAGRGGASGALGHTCYRQCVEMLFVTCVCLLCPGSAPKASTVTPKPMTFCLCVWT